jgi:tRNA threonylcarbamoyladenosine biosynthesis protein TsaB
MGLRATRKPRRFRRDTVREEGPLLLVCDTSSNYLNVILQRGPYALSTHTAYQPLSHARTLLPAIELALDEHRFSLADVDAFGVCLGPGSFTGLRVAMTTVKSFGFGADKPAVGVPTVEVLAASVTTPLPVGCLIDAKQGEAYSALFSAPADPAPDDAVPHLDGRRLLLAPEAGTPEDGLARILAAADGPVLLIGTACATYRERLEAAGNHPITFAPTHLHHPDGRTLARLCMARYEAGDTRPIEQLEPVYVGKPPIHKKRG